MPLFAAPTYFNIIEKFYLDENVQLPAGLVLNEITGAITGMPVEVMDVKTFTIFGQNQRGIVSTEITLSVRYGECKAEGNFPKTEVGTMATYDCAVAGSYIGTQKRACVLGAKDGEWQKMQGICVLVPLLVILLVIALVVIIIVLFVVIRISRKKKAVGGVKGKKKIEVTKTVAKKEVKV